MVVVTFLQRKILPRTDIFGGHTYQHSKTLCWILLLRQLLQMIHFDILRSSKAFGIGLILIFFFFFRNPIIEYMYRNCPAIVGIHYQWQHTHRDTIQIGFATTVGFVKYTTTVLYLLLLHIYVLLSYNNEKSAWNERWKFYKPNSFQIVHCFFV